MDMGKIHFGKTVFTHIHNYDNIFFKESFISLGNNRRHAKMNRNSIRYIFGTKRKI